MIPSVRAGSPWPISSNVHDLITRYVWLAIPLGLAINIVYYQWIRGAHKRETAAGRKAFDAGDFQTAERHYRLALGAALKSSRPPQSWLAVSYVNLGQVCRNTGREDDALRLYVAACELMPAAAAGTQDTGNLAFQLTAELLEEAGAWDEAVPFRQAGLDRLKALPDAATPETAEAWDRLGVTLFHAGRYPEAARAGQASAEAWRAAGGSGAQPLNAAMHTARALWEAGDRDQAEAMYRALIAELTPLGQERVDALAAVWTNLGLRLRQVKRCAGAVACLETAIELRRRQGRPAAVSHGLNNLAMVLLDDGQLDRSEKCAREAVSLSRESPDSALPVALDTLGRALVAQNRPEEALPCFDEACALLEGSAEDRTKLADYARRRADVLSELGRSRKLRRAVRARRGFRYRPRAATGQSCENSLLRIPSYLFLGRATPASPPKGPTRRFSTSGFGSHWPPL